jgi:hypothetical protein
VANSPKSNDDRDTDKDVLVTAPVVSLLPRNFSTSVDEFLQDCTIAASSNKVLNN